MTRATVSADGEMIIVHIPLTFRRRGGRKLVVTPDGVECAPRPRVDNAMVKGVARAFRWQRMLDDGVSGTIEELANRERVNRGYMCQMLRLTLLAPDLVEVILEGRQGSQLTLARLLASVKVGWEDQRREIAGPS